MQTAYNPYDEIYNNSHKDLLNLIYLRIISIF